MGGMEGGERGRGDLEVGENLDEGDVVELEGLEKNGDRMCKWRYGMGVVKEYFEDKMGE